MSKKAANIEITNIFFKNWYTSVDLT